VLDRSTVDTHDPAAAYDDHALVHCPSCDRCATVRRRTGALRLTCAHCGYVATALRQNLEPGPMSFLVVYNERRPPFDAPLWLETECCGGNRL
jgi:hypothetical protein